MGQALWSPWERKSAREKVYPVHNIIPGLAMKSLTSFFIFETDVVTSLVCEEVQKPIMIYSVGVIQVGERSKVGAGGRGRAPLDVV